MVAVNVSSEEATDKQNTKTLVKESQASVSRCVAIGSNTTETCTIACPLGEAARCKSSDTNPPQCSCELSKSRK